MDRIRMIHDPVGKTLTIWLDEPAKEATCQETAEEVVFMKDCSGRVIGFEVLHYDPITSPPAISMETAPA
jgi:hypothetical protein